MYDRLSVRDAESDHDGPNAVTAPRKRALRAKRFDVVRDPLKVPPHSTEAEQSVLGALLLDNSALGRISDILAIEDFYDDTHRLIFGALTALIIDGRPADVVTTADQLASTDTLEYVGGMAYLRALLEEVPSAVNVRAYALTVRERAHRRRLAAVGNEIADSAMRTAACDSATLLDDAAEKIDQLRIGAEISTLAPSVDWAQIAANPPTAVRHRVGNIFPYGTAGAIGAHGGEGKTQLAVALTICLRTGRHFYGLPTMRSKVAYIDAEEGANEMARRFKLQADAFGVSLEELQGGVDVFDLTAVSDGLLVAVNGAGDVEPTPLFRKLRANFRRCGYDVVIVDNAAAVCAIDVIRPAQVTRAITLLRELAPTDGNVILVLHVNRPTATAGYSRDGYSGTTAWNNRLRWRWYVFRPNAGEDAVDEVGDQVFDDGKRVFEVQKNNAGPTGLRIPMRIDGGALVADGLTDGIVGTIARGNERKAVLAALREAEDRGINVPTSETNRSTAYEALEAMPSYPGDLRGKAGKRRLYRILRQLRADRELEVHEFRTSGRKSREGYRLAPIQRQQQ
jgi:DnaB-like helicase N terminal domain/AAA domain